MSEETINVNEMDGDKVPVKVPDEIEMANSPTKDIVADAIDEKSSPCKQESVMDKDIVGSGTQDLATCKDSDQVQPQLDENEATIDNNAQEDKPSEKEPAPEDEVEKEVEKEASVKDDVKKETTNDKKVDENADEDEEESEEEERLGLLDRPVEVTGSRSRKKVERLDASYTAPEKPTGIDILVGKGIKLGDSPYIDHQISSTAAKDLKELHGLLFGRVGTATMIKKNIRKFSGFAFAEKSKDYDKKKAALEKKPNASLKKICQLFGLEVGGVKNEVVERIMGFLMKPTEPGKKVPKPKGKRGSKGGKKERRSSKSKEGTSVNGDEEESEEESEHEGASSEDEPDEKPTTSKRSGRGAAKTPAKGKKAAAAKATKATKRKSVVEQEDSDESSEEEPEPKKAKQMPTDEEIVALVKQILDKANLEEITMKKVVEQVWAKYPEFDLTHKKAFIKATIKEIIS